MSATVRGAVRELLEQTMPSSHACAHGKDVWTLITTDIDHEKIHIGQVLEGRYEGGTYRVVAKHVLMLEQDSLRSLAEDRAARSA